VKRINRFAVWRGERNVHRSGHHFLFHDPEVLIVEREAGPLRVLDDPDTEGLQCPLVERATPCDVTYWQPHMIKQDCGPLATVQVSRVAPSASDSVSSTGSPDSSIASTVSLAAGRLLAGFPNPLEIARVRTANAYGVVEAIAEAVRQDGVVHGWAASQVV